MRSGGGHAIRHLRDEGLIPNAGSLSSQVSAFEDLTSPILTSPSKTFDWTLGTTRTRAFAGSVGGRQVVVFVAKEGPYQGRVLSAVVPDANQVTPGGVPVSRLSSAISWSGTDVVLSLFVVWATGERGEIVQPMATAQPRTTRSYELEDVDEFLGGKSASEIDLIFDAVPRRIFSLLIHAWLTAAIRAGGVVAWFGFEGSFDFQHILTADVANRDLRRRRPGLHCTGHGRPLPRKRRLGRPARRGSARLGMNCHRRAQASLAAATRTIGRQPSPTRPTTPPTTPTTTTPGSSPNTADPLGNITKTVYDADGNKWKVTDASKNQPVFNYDENNNLASVVSPTATGIATVSYAYDPANQLITTIGADGQTTSYGYDSLGRKTSIIDPIGNAARRITGHYRRAHHHPRDTTRSATWSPPHGRAPPAAVPSRARKRSTLPTNSFPPPTRTGTPPATATTPTAANCTVTDGSLQQAHQHRPGQQPHHELQLRPRQGVLHRRHHHRRPRRNSYGYDDAGNIKPAGRPPRQRHRSQPGDLHHQLQLRPRWQPAQPPPTRFSACPPLDLRR